MRQWRSPKSVTANDNAQIDTAQSKFGGASGLFDGTGDYLSVPDSDDWNFGAGNFTIDFWVRFAALPATNLQAVFAGQYVDGSNRWKFHLFNSAGTYKWRFRSYNANATPQIDIAQTTSLLVDTWYHVTLIRSGSNWMFFQDGVQLGSTIVDADSIPDLASVLYIGSEDGASQFVNGWVDEHRISKGIARWIANFTPPNHAYLPDQYTVLLLHMDGVDTSTTFRDSTYKYGKLTLAPLVT